MNGAANRSTPTQQAAGSNERDPSDEDLIVLPDAVSAPVMIRRRTLLERVAAADQLPRDLAARAARQCAAPAFPACPSLSFPKRWPSSLTPTTALIMTSKQ